MMECCIAVIAYTMDEKVNGKKLYLDFNEKCRRLENDNAWRNFPYKSLYALLARAIHGIDNNPDVTNQIYYRGLKCRVTDLKADDCVFSSQFLSCTIDKNVAMQFISSTDDNAEGTLMVFEGSPMAACGVMNYSLFKDEQEMLVFPWSTFKVTRIITVSNLDEIFLKTIGPFITNLPYSGAYIKRGLMLYN